MASKFSGRLGSFISSDEDTFANPFTSPKEQVEPEVHSRKSSRSDEDDEDYSRKRKKKSKLEKILENGEQIKGSLYDDESIEAFDNYLSEYAIDDEDIELRQSLISKGRKYARETKVSAESSEIIKAFSGNEKMLNEIIDQVSEDIEMAQRDINQMRSMRTGRNNKAIVDMQMNKKELYGVKLAAIKEINGMKKTQFELQSKINKEKAMNDESGSSESLVNRAIGSILGSGRGNALSMVGGYGGVSGARGADEDYADTVGSDDEEYEEDVDSSTEDETIDENEIGRNYLKYEKLGVELVVTERSNGSYKVTAEDRDGNLIEDYPLPTNADHLAFHINEKLGTATDDFHRKYIYRREEE